MKKTISMLMVALASIVLLTSCLGDSENSYEGTVFVFIKKDKSYNLYAQSIYGGLYHENVSTLSEGDCAFVNMKILTDNKTSSGGYYAEKFDITVKYPYANQVVPVIQKNSVDTTALESNKLAFINFNANSSGTYNAVYDDDPFGRRRTMDFTCKMGPDEVSPKIELYYDSEAQYDLYGKPIADNERIIDIRMRRIGDEVSEDNQTSKQVSVAVNYQALHPILESFKDDEKAVYLRFRYHAYKNTDGSRYALTLTNKANIGFYYEEVEE